MIFKTSVLEFYYTYNDTKERKLKQILILMCDSCFLYTKYFHIGIASLAMLLLLMFFMDQF